MMNDVLSSDVLCYMLQFIEPIERVFIMNNVCRYWQQSLNLSSSKERTLVIRKAVVKYVASSSELFHPNSTLLSRRYDRLMFREMIARIAASSNLIRNSNPTTQVVDTRFWYLIWMWRFLVALVVLFTRIPLWFIRRTSPQQTPFRNDVPGGIPSIKLCICGDEDVGKTALFNRFCSNRFVDRKSKGALYCQHNVYCRYSEYERKANLEVWNVTGVENYASTLEINIRNSNCVLLCFDITNRESFENLKATWIPKVKSVKHQINMIEYVVVGLKADRSDERQVSQQEAIQFAEECLNVPYFEVKDSETPVLAKNSLNY